MRRLIPPMLLLIGLTAGCGVPVDSEPRPIDNPHVLRSDEPPGASAGSRIVRIYLVRAGRLERVAHRVSTVPTPQEQLDELLLGPSDADSAKGFTTALSTMTIDRLQITNRRALVSVGEPAVPGARSDEVLAYGQIVCTLTSQGADVGTVSFVSGDQPLAVPRADGSLSEGDLTIADYASLINS